ncbi:MAG: hypothetical protein JWL95_1740 [Gemmatimonadetes bacterium]|nr:hypothetical protein [Gemmatimonadota bacterium]
MPFMWGDTLLAAERAHLLRLMFWGGSCLLVGTALIAALRVARHRSTLLDQFALVTAGWGAVELTLALWGSRMAEVRDLSSATRLDRALWLCIGLDAGYVLVGLTLLVVGWRVARHAGVVGAGIAAVVQGLALGVLDLVLANQISR